MDLDEPDRRILRALQDQPDLTLRELGEVAGLSHSPCWRRLQRLQETGAISPKRLLISTLLLGS